MNHWLINGIIPFYGRCESLVNNGNHWLIMALLIQVGELLQFTQCQGYTSKASHVSFGPSSPPSGVRMLKSHPSEFPRIFITAHYVMLDGLFFGPMDIDINRT